jgi:hypothetical protein
MNFFNFILSWFSKPQPAVNPVPAPVIISAEPKKETKMSDIIITADYQISPNFTLGDLVKTENRNFIEQNFEEGKKKIDVLARLCKEILDPLHDLMGHYTINSCFRCPDLNAAVGGSSTSQHKDAEAADTVYKLVQKESFNKIAFNSNIKFSQIIIEFGWIHIGMIDEILHPGKVMQRMVASKDTSGKIIYTTVTKPI